MCYISFKNSTLHKTAIAPENSAWKDTFLSFWEFQPFFRGELLVSSKVIHLSHEKKTSYTPLYWLFKRDQYNVIMVYMIIPL